MFRFYYTIITIKMQRFFGVLLTINTNKGMGAVKDILATIVKLREARGWTEYQLAERSGLPQSTISSWYRKGMIPSVPSLEKICGAFGITLSQLFAEGEDKVALNESQRKLLKSWARLNEEQQAAVLQLLEKM